MHVIVCFNSFKISFRAITITDLSMVILGMSIFPHLNLDHKGGNNYIFTANANL